MSKWKPCAVKSCLRPARCKALCEQHYKRARYQKCGLAPEVPIGGWIKKRVATPSRGRGMENPGAIKRRKNTIGAEVPSTEASPVPKKNFLF